MLVLAYTISSADLVQHWQAERGLQWNSILSILDLIPTLACAWEDATAARGNLARTSGAGPQLIRAEIIHRPSQKHVYLRC